MSEQESIRVVEEFFAAWNAKDWECWAQLHAENAYHAGPDHAQPLHGREAILTAHQGLGKVFPDFRYDISRIFAHDDLVCAEWILTGTHQGAIPGLEERSSRQARPSRFPAALSSAWLMRGCPNTSNTWISWACMSRWEQSRRYPAPSGVGKQAAR